MVPETCEQVVSHSCAGTVYGREVYQKARPMGLLGWKSSTEQVEVRWQGLALARVSIELSWPEIQYDWKERIHNCP